MPACGRTGSTGRCSGGAWPGRPRLGEGWYGYFEGERYVHRTYCPYRGTTGAMVGVVGYSRDLTELKWSEAWYAAITAAAPGCIIVFDDAGQGWSSTRLRSTSWTFPARTRSGGRSAHSLIFRHCSLLPASPAPRRRRRRIGWDAGSRPMRCVPMARASRLSQHRPHLRHRVGFVTGDTFDSASEGFLARTARPILEKPFMPSSVRQLLADIRAASLRPE